MNGPDGRGGINGLVRFGGRPLAAAAQYTLTLDDIATMTENDCKVWRPTQEIAELAAYHGPVSATPMNHKTGTVMASQGQLTPTRPSVTVREAPGAPARAPLADRKRKTPYWC